MTIQDLIFISDIHLGAKSEKEEKDRVTKFLNFLKEIENKAQKIFIVGDLFDFWLGDFFSTEMGIIIHENDWSGTIDGKKFYLYHGDGIAKKDSGYRFMKKILRNKTNLKIYRWLHPDIGIPFARFISGSSRLYTDRIDLKDNDDYIEFARGKFEEGYDMY